ncbi:hypothetical protein ATOBIA_N13820 [Atopobiaceae bacterium P1]|nr:hypothetical protein ATOBIA_N13820 [Atopobiaceae bacterium P1]
MGFSSTEAERLDTESSGSAMSAPRARGNRYGLPNKGVSPACDEERRGEVVGLDVVSQCHRNKIPLLE